MTQGHVFVVHGKIQDVTCDAILIPTDHMFHVEHHWIAVIGGDPPRPDGWPQKGRGSTEPFWFIDVADPTVGEHGPRIVCERLRERVSQIAEHLAERRIVRNRTQHLVAMPLLASGAGVSSPRTW